jgi:hypothetical protein
MHRLLQFVAVSILMITRIIHGFRSLHHLQVPTKDSLVAKTIIRCQNTFQHHAEFMSSSPERISLDQISTQQQKQQEVWLDLRATAMNPNEAIFFLNELVTENYQYGSSNTNKNTTTTTTIVDLKQFIDRILVNEATIVRGRASGKLEDCSVSLLYETSTKQEVMAYEHNTNTLSIPFGRRIECAPTVMIDPVAALDLLVETSNQWVLMDADPVFFRNNNKISWWTEQVSGLLDIITSNIHNKDAAASASGLFLPGVASIRNKQQRMGGGIAIVCPTTSALVEIDAIVAQRMLSSQMTACDTGLFIPTTTGLDNDDDESKGAVGLATALVIPFEAAVWKTLLALR